MLDNTIEPQSQQDVNRMAAIDTVDGLIKEGHTIYQIEQAWTHWPEPLGDTVEDDSYLWLAVWRRIQEVKALVERSVDWVELFGEAA